MSSVRYSGKPKEQDIEAMIYKRLVRSAGDNLVLAIGD